MPNRFPFQGLLKRRPRSPDVWAVAVADPPAEQMPDFAPQTGWEPPDVVPMLVSMEISPEADHVRETCARILQERVDLLGTERSGAYEHYHALLEFGLPIPSYELAIVDLVRRRLPDMRSYHEVGSGLGMLPFMLAQAGFASVGIERDQRRHLTAMAILRELTADNPQMDAQCRLIGAAFPEAVADIDVSESMAIVTDLVSTHAREEFLRICRGLSRYRYVLLDVQRFSRKRDTEEEFDELLRELFAFGLTPFPEIIDLGGQGRYYLFERRSTKQQLAPAGGTALQPGDAARDLAKPQPVPVETPVTRVPDAVLPPSPQRATRKRFGGAIGVSALLMIGLPAIVGGFYYGKIAANQYVTNFEFAVRTPLMAKGGAAASASGAFSGGSMMSPDAFIISDYINGQQAVEDVGKDVNLRAMYSEPHGDLLSRLDKDVTTEGLTAYWQQMVNAHFDLVSGNVTVSVRAFTPEDSLKLSQTLIAKSDETFRRLNHQAQQDFVRLADENVTRAEKRLSDARYELRVFREKSGILDAGKMAVSSTALTDNLRKELASRLTQYETLKASSPNAPALATLKTQIAALQAQIKGGPQGQNGNPITEVTPETLGRFETLELNRQFAEKQYTEALSLREKAYMSAQDQQSYLALFVKPALAQLSLYPDRIKSFATVVLAAAAAWFVSVLVTYAVRDHLM